MTMASGKQHQSNMAKNSDICNKASSVMAASINISALSGA